MIELLMPWWTYSEIGALNKFFATATGDTFLHIGLCTLRGQYYMGWHGTYAPKRNQYSRCGKILSWPPHLLCYAPTYGSITLPATRKLATNCVSCKTSYIFYSLVSHSPPAVLAKQKRIIAHWHLNVYATNKNTPKAASHRSREMLYAKRWKNMWSRHFPIGITVLRWYIDGRKQPLREWSQYITMVNELRQMQTRFCLASTCTHINI